MLGLVKESPEGTFGTSKRMEGMLTVVSEVNLFSVSALCPCLFPAVLGNEAAEAPKETGTGRAVVLHPLGLGEHGSQLHPRLDFHVVSGLVFLLGF